MDSGLRIAIVGSGPAGFYAAGALLDAGVEVDMIERLPTPWGLVRLGVAPDHPKIKSVSAVFEKIASRPGFRFLGNVEAGRDLTHEDLLRLYDAVIYACGAQSERHLNIPGENLKGCWAALEFVAWYNGHPDYQDLDFDLQVERAVVIGNGNVALDVARMLALTREELAVTDTTDAAIAAIANASIREIVVIGRRGPAQAAFTNPELKELAELKGADVIVDPADLELDPVSAAALEHDVNARRNLVTLQQFAAREPQGHARRLVLKFFRSPVAIDGKERVEAIDLVRNQLVADASGVLRAVPTDERDTLPCGLVFRSVGYHGLAVSGVPFDASRGTILNEGGRVQDASGAVVPGVYCTGWIKRGPTGVIGTNKKDSVETVEQLLDDVRGGQLAHRADVTAAAVDQLLEARGVNVVWYQGWQAIDSLERARGAEEGRPRVKLCSWDALLSAAGAERRYVSWE